ncbi:MAG: tetratricopeptide repeat protein [candidate division Zixibacteria bacterium]|nr:tetratricopeptide repeat protein [candidate division Zixibacteria bacterium]
MKNDPVRKSFITPELIAYYLTLSAFFVASFFPQYRVWGINWWAYFPIGVKLGLLVIGIAAPFVIDRLLSTTLKGKDDVSPRAYRWLVGGFVVVMLALFYLLRARTHFLGDGYTLISLMTGENHLIKPREFGGTIFQYLIYKALGSRGEPDAIFAYQIISFSAGVAFLAVSLWAAAKLLSRRLDRLLFVLSVAGGGYMLLYFGYIENYAFFVVSVFLFAVTGVRVTRQEISRYWLVPSLALTIFFHIFGVVLTPVLLFLLLRGTPLENWFISRSLSVRIAMLTLLAAALAGVFAFFYVRSLFFRLALLPVAHNQFTVGGYTMFSADHLIDLVNMILIAFPAIGVATVAILRNARRPFHFDSLSVVLLGLILCTFGPALIFDPKLGMPRDWDLFCFAGVPVALAVALILLKPGSSRFSSATMLVVIVLNGLLFIPRAVSLALPVPMIHHVEQYCDLDPVKSGPTRFILQKYFLSRQDFESARLVATRWQAVDPDLELLSAGPGGAMPMDHDAWKETLRRMTVKNPAAWIAWANLGVLYMLELKNDSAFTSLQMAAALNPFSPRIQLNLGLCLYRLGSFEKAERCYLDAVSVDTAETPVLLQMADLYKAWGREDKFTDIFSRIAQRPDAPPKYVAGWITFLLSEGRDQEAARTFTSALSHGIDSSEIVACLAGSVTLSGSSPTTQQSTPLSIPSSDWENAVRRSVVRTPTSWTAWGNLGHVYLLSDQYDSALYALNIAVALNELNAANVSNLAYAHFYLGDNIAAEKRWNEATRLDSTAIEPMVGLSKLYRRKNDQTRYAEYFEKIVSRPDAPPEYLKTLGDYYLSHQRYRDAAAAYNRAVRNGLNPAVLDSLQGQYPQLKPSPAL